jgi:acyl carrier protein
MNNNEVVVAEVFELLRQMAPTPLEDRSDLTDMHLIHDLGYHSVALVELSYALEDVFELDAFTIDEVEHVQTAGQLAEFVAGRTPSRPPAADDHDRGASETSTV